MKLSLLATGSAVSLLVAFTGCGGDGDNDVPPNAVAKVGDTAISNGEFKMRFEAIVRSESKGGKPISYEPPDFDRCVAAKDKQNAAPEGAKGKSEDTLRKECQQDYQRLRTQTMEFMLQQEWVRHEAAQAGVKATPGEVQKQFAAAKKQSFPTEKAYKEFLLTSGRSEKDLRLEVEASLLQQKLAKKVTAGKLKVSDAEVEAYYAKNKKTLGKPESRAVRVVIAKTEARADAAKQALDGGQDWKAVAKEFSIDKTSAAKGGLLPAVATTGDKKVDAALKDAQIGTVSEPTKTQFGWWIFEVEKVTPATVPPLKDVRAQIVPTVKSEKQQKALDEFAKDFREEYRGQTVCADDFKVASCKNGPETNPTTPAPKMQQPQPEQDN